MTVQKDSDFLSVYLARITLKNVLQGDNQTHSGNAENARNQRGERVDWYVHTHKTADKVYRGEHKTAQNAVYAQLKNPFQRSYKNPAQKIYKYKSYGICHDGHTVKQHQKSLSRKARRRYRAAKDLEYGICTILYGTCLFYDRIGKIVFSDSEKSPVENWN